jgi:hypothetical protein
MKVMFRPATAKGYSHAARVPSVLSTRRLQLQHHHASPRNFYTIVRRTSSQIFPVNRFPGEAINRWPDKPNLNQKGF